MPPSGFGTLLRTPSLLSLVALFCSIVHSSAQTPITIHLPASNENLQADQYGSGTLRGVVLAHGGPFDKESWKSQAQALASAGFLVLALQFRGDHVNPDGSAGSSGETKDNADDVLAAVAYLHRKGVKEVSAVGGSMGGDAVGEADARSRPGEFSRIVLLGSSGGDLPGKLNGRKLFIIARNDASSDGPRLPGILSHYAKSSKPKRLIVVEGSAHAQYLFASAQGNQVWNAIRQFLTER